MVGALLGLGGLLKLRRPEPTVGALRAMGLPARASLVRLLAAIELAVAVGAAALDSPVVAALVAASYAAFAAFVLVALVRHLPLGSCGCFGVEDTPPTVLHLLLNLGAAAVAAAVALGSEGAGLGHVLAHEQPLTVGAFLLLTGTTVWLAYAALTLLPRTLAAGRAPSRRPA
jgi:hypothetical protein